MSLHTEIIIGIILGLYWGYIGIILGFYWDYARIILGLYWNHTEIILGIILGLYWGYTGIMLTTLINVFAHCVTLYCVSDDEHENDYMVN